MHGRAPAVVDGRGVAALVEQAGELGQVELLHAELRLRLRLRLRRRVGVRVRVRARAASRRLRRVVVVEAVEG